MCMFNRNCLTTKLTMISKELLTAIRKDEHKVLNTDLNYIEKDNKIGYLLDNRQWYFINIYELAHLCKEWLENNTHWDLMIIGYEVYLMEDIWGEGGACNHKRFTTQREWFLNLFDACEYIMKLKEIK